MKFYDIEPKVVHQGIDSLEVDYFSSSLIDYTDKFLPFLKILESIKEEAKESSNDFGAKTVQNTLGLELGNFQVSSRGQGKYRYYFENENMIFRISTAKFETDFSHVRIRFRASFLFRMGHKKAYEIGNLYVSKILGAFRTKVYLLDLATDVWGIRYTKFDSLRFQTLSSTKDFCEVMDFREYGRAMKVQGFHFGQRPKLFRIYDKTHKIQMSPSERYIKEKWKFNGYDKDKNIPVFRHEMSLSRDYLKRILPRDLGDEVSYVFENLARFWATGTKIARWVDLTDKEVMKLGDGLVSAEGRKKIFARAKKDVTRFDLWALIEKWDNQIDVPFAQRVEIKPYDEKQPMRHFKAFVGSVYKSMGANPQNLVSVVLDTQQKLMDFEGCTVHEYGLNRTACDVVKAHNMIEKYNIVVEHDYKMSAKLSYREFNEALLNVKSKDIQNNIIKAMNLISA
jgi:hypothetical protein